MKKHQFWMAAAALAASISFGSAQQTADTIFHNGKVLTVDAKIPALPRRWRFAAPKYWRWEPTMRFSAWPGPTRSGLT